MFFCSLRPRLFVHALGFGRPLQPTAADWLSDEDRLRALADKARATELLRICGLSWDLYTAPYMELPMCHLTPPKFLMGGVSLWGGDFFLLQK